MMRRSHGGFRPDHDAYGQSSARTSFSSAFQGFGGVIQPLGFTAARAVVELYLSRTDTAFYGARH